MNLKYLLVGSLVLLSSLNVQAGNKDRIGQAGAQELLINPWTRSAGMAGAGSASIEGLESLRWNVSGLAFTNKTELMFSHKTWIGGSDIDINAFGFSQKVGSSGVLGLSVMSMSFGEIEFTTVDLPEGGIGTFSPQFINLGLSYARAFSESIFGGLTVRSISESIASSGASGVAFDAGIRYVRNNLKFGIALRNVGPKMQFSGDGFATKVFLNNKEFTLNNRSEAFELPSILNMGISYDLLIGERVDEDGKALNSEHRVTFSSTFTSNSFGKDLIRGGVEYSFREIVMLRAGLAYEEGMFDDVTSSTSFAGPAFGATIQAPLNANKSTFNVDYSFEPGNPFPSHGIAVRINI